MISTALIYQYIFPELDPAFTVRKIVSVSLVYFHQLEACKAVYAERTKFMLQINQKYARTLTILHPVYIGY